MNVSDNTISLYDNDIYIIINIYNDMSNIDDIYIFLEHILTEWKQVEYNKFINNRMINKQQLFNFFNYILLGIKNIFIVDKKYKPLYHIKIDGMNIATLVEIII